MRDKSISVDNNTCIKRQITNKIYILKIQIICIHNLDISYILNKICIYIYIRGGIE